MSNSSPIPYRLIELHERALQAGHPESVCDALVETLKQVLGDRVNDPDAVREALLGIIDIVKLYEKPN